MLKLDDYDYTLPSALIAQTPADPPESCKLLVYDKKSDTITESIFSDITQLIEPNTLIVFNNSKVVKARLVFSPVTQEPPHIRHNLSKEEVEKRGLIRNGYHLPYNQDHIAHAKTLRKNMTLAEKKLWHEFFKEHSLFARKSSLAPLTKGGVSDILQSTTGLGDGGIKMKVLRQQPIDHYIVDFYIPSAKLVIEIDGEQHHTNVGKQYDQARSEVLECYGIHIMRYTNQEILEHFDHVCEKIVSYLREFSTSSVHTTTKTQEIFYLASLNTYTFTALVRPGKKFKVGQTIPFMDNITFHVDAITEEGRQLTCSHPIAEILETYGQMPLPPYITYEEEKAPPYQPVFAEKEGSVAAPTASLHFTHNLISQLEQQGVQTAYTTLHVGLGTFKQVDVEDITSYHIHSEKIAIDISLFDRIAQAKRAQHPLLAVGTTVTRTLESLPYLWKALDVQPTTLSPPSYDRREQLTRDISREQAKHLIHDIQVDTSSIQFASTLFLYPGKPFYLIDQLITNFHLPKSSLLMLVAGYIGYEQMRTLYRHAIEHQYRFYSFGDAMWVK